MSLQELIPIYPPAPVQGEILGAEDEILCWVSPMPFAPTQSRRAIWVPLGSSIEDIVQRAQPSPVRRRFTQVWVNSEHAESYIERKFWSRVRPRLGSVVYIMALPGDRQQFLQLAILAVAIAIPFTVGPESLIVAGSLGGSLFTAGVGIIGNLAIAALIPPPNQGGGGVDQLRRISTFQTFRNVLDPWGLFERPIGKCRIFPAHLAEPYSDIRDEQEWKRFVFAVRGPCEFEDFRFGNTAADKLRRIKIRHTQGWPANPITFTSADVDLNQNKINLPGHPYIRNNPVRFRDGNPPNPIITGKTYWIVSRTKNAVKLALEPGGDPIIFTGTGSGATIFRREPRPKIYPGVVFEDPVNITLLEGVDHIVTTQPNTDEAKVIFFFPQGLGKFDDVNPEDIDPQSVLARVRYRLKGTTTWSNSDDVFYDAQNSPRIPRPQELSERIDGSWTKVRTLGVYAVSMNPDNGKIEVSLPVRTPAPLPGPGRPTPPPGGERGAIQPTLAPFPPDRIPIAYVTRASDDNNKINISEIEDRRPTVSDTKFPKGVRFENPTDFAPRPTSPRRPKIRIRRGTLKKAALNVTAKKQEQFFRTVEFEFPEPGEYEIQVRRTNSAGGKGVFDRVDLAALQSFTNENILDEQARREGIALIEVLALAQDNLEGIADKFNCLATSIFQRFDGTDWEYGPTENVAECVRGILQGPGNINPVPDSRLVLADFEEFATWCADKRYTCGQIVDFLTTVREQAADIASVARGSLARVDLNIGITIDRLKTNRVTIFARHNIVKGSLSVDLPFQEVPHSLRVRFRNQRADYNFDEIEVFGDDYDDETRDRSKVEVLNVPMITRPGHAKEYARYLWLVAKHRQKRLNWISPLHGFAQRHGDLNGLNHDVAFFGSGSARVIAITTSVGRVDTVTLSTPVIMEFGKSYRVQFVKPDAGPPVGNRILVLDVDTVVGEQSVLTLTTPPLIADGPAVDEMIIFGELGKEVIDVVVGTLAPVSPYRARFQCWELAPAVFQVDGEVFDEDPSVVTIPPDIDRPVILGIVSDEAAARIVHDGSVEIGILVSLKPPQALSFFATRLEAQIRESPGVVTNDEIELATWSPLPFLPISNASVRFPAVRIRRTYEIRLRYASDQVPGIDWVTVTHQVTGPTELPPDVASVTATLDEANWTYPDPPNNLKGFRIRAHFGGIKDWNTALPLHDGLVRSAPFIITNLRRTGFRTLLVKAVNVYGAESMHPASVRFDFGIPTPENVVLTADSHPTFPGTIVNGSVISNVLQANDTTKHWLANDDHPYWKAEPTYPFWTAASEKYDEMTYEFSYRPTSKGSLSVEIDIEALDGYKLEIRKDKVALFWRAGAGHWLADPNYLYWDATPGEYSNLPGSLDVEVDDYTIRLTTFSGTRQAKVMAITTILDVPDVVERLADVAIPAGGVRLTLANAFTAITEVKPTLQVSGTAVRIDVVDLDAQLGPLVVAVAAGGALVPGIADFVVIGYRQVT